MERPAPTTPSPLTPDERGEARLLETRELLSGSIRQRWAAAWLARSVRPGQYVYVSSPRKVGLLLPALPVAGFDRTAGIVELLIESGAEAAAGELGRLRVGDQARFEGPLGRGFEFDPRSRYLLVVADDSGIARVRAILDEAVSTGRQVALLYGAAGAGSVLPSSSLPDEAEYVIATADGSIGTEGEVTDLVGTYEAWADQCFAAGRPELLRHMSTLAQGRDGRMGVARLGRKRGRKPLPGSVDARRRSWLQVALPHATGCALGVCLGCAVEGERGSLRVCREGPTFAATDLRSDPSR